jgi:hypothetical protein
VQRRPRRRLDEVAQLVDVVDVDLVLHADRAHDVEPGAGETEPGEGPDGAVEALVGLDEADGDEAERVGADAEGGADGGAIVRVDLGGEVGAVMDDLDPVRAEAEGFGEGGALGLGVHLDPPRRRPQAPQELAVHAGAPLRLELVDAELDVVGADAGAEQRCGHGEAFGDRRRVRVEDVGVVLDDDAVVAGDPPGERGRAAWATQPEVVVRGGRLRRQHLDLVALE